MRLRLWFALGWAVGGGFGLSSAGGAGSPTNTVVQIQIDRGTNLLGTVDVELFDQDKPETVRNFLLYVRSGAYSNSFLHRCVPGFIVQGGGFTVTNPLASTQARNFDEVRNFGRLTNEFGVGTRWTNLFGTIAMAKVGDDPNSATSQWFFNLTNNAANLDNQNGGFTVFGRILDSTNANQGSNVLQHFNTLRTGAGIVNLASLLGSAYSVFSELPVSYTNSSIRAPTNSELYYVRLSVVGETNAAGPGPPTVTLLTPAPNARFTNQPVVLRGMATDDQAVARVAYRVQGGALETATGTTNWEIGLFPQPGFTTVTVESYDWEGHRSTNPVSSTFFYVSQIALNLQTNGSGSIVGLTNGQLLQAGKFYTVVAKPARGTFFTGWTGAVSSASASFTFQVPLSATNFTLAAGFLNDFFPRLTGSYQGLLRDTNSTTLDNTGFISLTLGRKGAFSGRILHRGGRYSYTSRFDRNGNAFLQGTIGGTSRTISLRLDTTNEAGLITGTYGSAEVQLERLASPTLSLIPTNAPALGQYLFVIAKPPVATSGQPQPGGHGFGTATMNRNGMFKYRGNLGDGTAISGVSRWTRLRRTPLYLSLARNQGVLSGWISNTNLPSLLEGRLQWIRLPDVAAPTYPAGFSLSTGTNLLPFVATNYTRPPAGSRLFKWVNGLTRIEGANVVTGVSNLVRVTATNSLALNPPNPDQIELQLDLNTGLAEGRFRHPWLGTTNLLRGILFAPGESIRGQFIDLDQTGSFEVSLTPFLLTQNVANVTLPGFKSALSEGGLLRFDSDASITLNEACSIRLDTVLDANGHNVRIEGGSATRLFEVQTNVQFGLIGVTLANGTVIGTAGTNGPNPQPGGDAAGAGILNLGGFLTLTNCLFTNFVVHGGAGGATTSTNVDASGGRGLGAVLCNRGGRIAAENCQFLNNTAEGGPGQADEISETRAGLRGGSGLGGAIFSDGLEVVFTNCLFAENLARGGAAQTTSHPSNTVGFTRSGPGLGGALGVAGGTLQVLSCRFLTNQAAGQSSTTNVSAAGSALGGAIFTDTNVQSELVLSWFTGNTANGGNALMALAPAPARGGALYSAGAVRVDRCGFEQNEARGGSADQPGDALGGALAVLGSLTIDASTFEQNLAQGGAWNGTGPTNTPAGSAGGGAIYSNRGTLALTNSTLAFNRALSGPETSGTLTNGHMPGERKGGALLSISNSASLLHVTLAFNQAGSAPAGGTNSGTVSGGGIASVDSSLILRNSILVTNVPANLPAASASIDGGYNFSSDASLALNTTGSRTNIDAMLGPLTTNGGPTRTMTLLASSPARDAIPTNSIVRSDQRGIDRPQGTGGDAGAVEVIPTAIPPVFSVQPVGGTVRVGTNYIFQVTVTGTAPLSYSWLKDGSFLAHATNSSLSLSNLQPVDAGGYLVIVTNTAGAATSTVAVLVVDARPLISAEPDNLVLAPGGAGSFSVTASGPALRYNWLRDGSALSSASATNATLLINNAAPPDRGSYQVIITNDFGSATSRLVTLTFSPAALSILAQPSSLLVQTGATATFSVLVSGVPPFNYQWFLGSIPLPDQTNSSLVLTNVTQAEAGVYRVVITNAYASVTSGSASLVIEVTSAPFFTLQPTGGVVRVGSNFTLHAQATGTAPITYFWLKDGLLLSGATNTTLAFTNITTTNAGDYAAVAVNNVGSGTSSVATITVDGRPLITAQPADIIVAPGATATFSVGANGPDLAYVWMHNDQPIVNATNTSLVIATAAPANRGVYQVVITNVFGSTTSRLANLSFDSTALSILSQPANVLIRTGQVATFSVIVGGVPPFAYQWWFATSPVAGETNSTLLIPNVVDLNAGLYRVVVTNAYLSVTSAPALLTIETPPIFSLQPTGGMARLSSNFTFQVLATGALPMSYRWLKDGELLPDATNATFVVTNIQLTNAGSYVAAASNRLGEASSTAANLTIDLSPLIVTEPADVAVAPGATTNFLVEGTGPDLTYAWSHAGQPIAQATNAMLTITNAGPADRGPYQVVITNLFGAATSRLASLSFDTNALVIVTQPTNVLVQTGQVATFTVVVDGSPPFAYQWWFGAGALPNETNSTLVLTNVSDAQAGSYEVLITNAYLSVTSSPAALNIAAAFAPAARSVPALRLSVQNKQLVITCQGVPGQVYQLLSSDTLNAAEHSWLLLDSSTVPPTGTISWTFPIPTEHAIFFRAASP